MRGLRRLTYRHERGGLEDVLQQTRALEADLASDIAHLETDRDKLTDEHDRYVSWKGAHAPDLHRLRRIDADINAITRRPVGVDRTATMEHEIDTGLGL